jgi:glycosyltransferase involved in cell wall biosynthesis
MTVSVVIPVYNVKLYLKHCVRSVLDQTFQDLEIILVDDGSTDGSGDLCDQIAADEPRIRVVHQQNQGLSGARNTGLHQATGEYVAFLDSDDRWLLPDGLELLLKEKKTGQPDIIIFKNVDIWQDGHCTAARDYDVEKIRQLADGQRVFEYLVANQQFRMSACFLLVRRELLLEHNILFPLGLISEDIDWSMHLWQHVETVVVTNMEFYGYYHREASLSTTTTLRVYESYDKIFTYWKAQCNQNCKNADIIRAYLANMWVNRGYSYHLLADKDKPVALRILRQHAGLLDYGHSAKSKRIRRMVQFTGVRATAVMLGWYWRLRSCIKH